MYRKLAGLGLCVAMMLGAACSKDEPVAQRPVAPVPTSIDGLPTGTGLEHVDVTTPATPTSIDPQLLPPNARRASAMANLTAEQRVCIDDTIYETIKRDPSISSDQARLASVMGSAMALCGGDTFAKSVVEGLVGSLQGEVDLTDEQRACVESTMKSDQDLAARFLGAAATADLEQVAQAFEGFESACNLTLPDS